MAQIVLTRLTRKLGDAVQETHSEHGNETVVVVRERLLEVACFLRDDRELDFNLPVDCTVVDWLGKKWCSAARSTLPTPRITPRFEVVWHLYSLARGHRVRLKVRVSDTDPTCASLTPVWPGMNWHEREAYDMYGICFVGHPGQKRILLYEEFVGHPLRKDYPIDKRQPLIEMRPVKDVPTQLHPRREQLNRP